MTILDYLSSVYFLYTWFALQNPCVYTRCCKNCVLYDDGDVEVLRLDKERWELVDNGHKPTKIV
ncbi:hypothetical protein CsSME_00048275 [Camellia sinensis var. sinensis]